jgi:uncharacterized damage-inducible protein DinB
MKSVRALAILIAAAWLGSIAAAKADQNAAAPASGFKADSIGNIDYASKELVSLAEAMPAEKYSWRPAPGVRSVSEVYMHVAIANYYLPSFAGTKVPEGIDREMETKVTDKAKVVDALKKSIDHLRTAISNTPDAELDTKVKAFGRDLSKRAIFLIALGHIHEHLGQSIAYARSNGVTPPWSASEGEPAKKTGK